MSTDTETVNEVHQLHFSDAVIDVVMDTDGEVSVRITGEADFSIESWRSIAVFVDRVVTSWADEE